MIIENWQGWAAGGAVGLVWIVIGLLVMAHERREARRWSNYARSLRRMRDEDPAGFPTIARLARSATEDK